ncbi:sigma-54 dependent transcriptional regulator [Thermodesulforhabdus norvegica]|uniref:Two-component system, response regulator FlrC n=1 Tax=Thermodesulforhabdus norvegica TaxID=39841 RepID=A0A1I4R772_9BACT|nr:sigma-54 dependent transcriptional regulator [Thermodesulforhabdus norvegica]SFM47856.1 two-component system, response regulator FlrC [Thermodesulforhabdus norvegica]
MEVVVIGQVEIPEGAMKAAGWQVFRSEGVGSQIPSLPDGRALVVFLKSFSDPEQTVKVLQKIKARTPEPYVIVLTDVPSFDEAVYVMKNGADDFWVMPTPEERFLSTLEWLRDTFFNQSDLVDESVERPIVSVSPRMQQLKQIALQVARSDASVFIQGESGTGKELFARFIHARSSRSKGPFVAVNCAAIPESLMESELFGFERGAFTGATRQKAGKFELAHGGTLLLDEVTEIPIHLQAKLLRVIQEGEIDRIGGKKPVKVNVRIIATTNISVEEQVREGKFRKDLYYRLNVIPLKIPPLRERVEDIIPLARHFVQKFCRAYNMSERNLTPEAERKLLQHSWPGNVRELENVIHRAILLRSGSEIGPSEIVFDNLESEGSLVPLMPIREMEREMIFRALEVSNGNRTKAAEILGITVRTLRNKLREYRQQGLL